MNSREVLHDVLKKSDLLEDTQLSTYRKVLLLAPHQDDETLGCAGLIQRLAQLGAQLYVVFLTDGAMSHPHSTTYTAPERTGIRNAEAIRAVAKLGIKADKLFFLNAPDSALPQQGEADHAKYSSRLEALAVTIGADLILSPYRLDPHCDHRATYQLADYLATTHRIPLWEYPIWVYELGRQGDLEALQQLKIAQLILSPKEQALKMEALHCHRSQLDARIFNDPTGFLLTEQVISHFNGGKEYFFMA